MQTASNRHSAEKHCIIVVDNDIASGEALRLILADDSQTFVMPDVVAALDWASHWPPELIFLGRSIIAIEGAGTVRRFKNRVPGVKILIVCDAQNDDEGRQARLHGAESILLRPLRRNAVRRKVHEVLARASTQHH